MGTEDTYVASFQPVFRQHSTDNLAGLKSHCYGRSPANQV